MFSHELMHSNNPIAGTKFIDSLADSMHGSRHIVTAVLIGFGPVAK
jgi:hypothetical protein